MNVAAVLLAAGSSSRMGRPKQLLPFQGTTLIRAAARNALASECSEVVVVLGARAGTIMKELSGLPVRIQCNEDWAKGIGTSIACGVREAMANVAELDVIVLLLADQPRVSELAINQLIDMAASSGAAVVASAYQGTVGVPALFSRALFGELLALPPDQGAKHLIARRSDCVTVPIPEAACDIDTREDYDAVCRGV